MKDSFIFYFKCSLLSLIDLILRHIPVKTTAQYDVAIIRTDGIGDFVMWAGAIPAYKKKYEGKRILFVYPDSYTSLVNRLHCFNNTITINKKGIEDNFWVHLKTMWRFRHIEADIVINPTRYRIYPSDLLAGMMKAKERIGVNINKQSTYFKVVSKFYNVLIDVPSELKNEMLTTEFITRYITDSNYTHKIADFRPYFNENDNDIPSPYCVIALSTSAEYKIWDIYKVCELIQFIPKQYKIVLTGYGKKDEERAAIIEHNSPDHKVFNKVGKTSILDLVNITSQAAFVLGNDSSTVHIAACCRVPSICYMSGGTYDEFLPYADIIADKEFHPRTVVFKMDCFGCFYKCVHEQLGDKPCPCLRNVSVDMVKKELDALLVEIDKN